MSTGITRTADLVAAISRWERRRITRRAAVAGGAALALAAATRGARAQGGVSEITVLGYGGLYGDSQKKAVLDPFTEQTGIKINLVTGQSAIPALVADSQKSEPLYDVVYMTNIEHQVIKNQGGLLAEYDQDRVPNLKDIYPIALDMPYAANVELDAWGLLYNTEAISTPPDSWAALWDPAYAGQVAFEIPSAGLDLILNLVAASIVGGGTETDVDTIGFEQVKKLKGQAIFADEATSLTSFQNQDVILLPEYNNEAYFMQDEGFPSAFAFPKEGAFPVAVWLGMPKNLSGARKEAAETFINYYLGPEPQTAIAKLLYAGPTNKTVTLESDLQGKVVYGDLVDQLFDVDWAYVLKNQDAWVDRWNREIASS
ncbi:MAG: extracellular solute-binding protein [Thermomicrobiales bacterium]|nr:extracellular solute-binding protein [Thermomicrobiales bacterium]